MGETNAYLKLWRETAMAYSKKKGISYKQALSSQEVKREYAKKKAAMDGSGRKTKRMRSPTKHRRGHTSPKSRKTQYSPKSKGKRRKGHTSPRRR